MGPAAPTSLPPQPPAATQATTATRRPAPRRSRGLPPVTPEPGGRAHHATPCPRDDGPPHERRHVAASTPGRPGPPCCDHQQAAAGGRGFLDATPVTRPTPHGRRTPAPARCHRRPGRGRTTSPPADHKQINSATARDTHRGMAGSATVRDPGRPDHDGPSRRSRRPQAPPDTDAPATTAIPTPPRSRRDAPRLATAIVPATGRSSDTPDAAVDRDGHPRLRADADGTARSRSGERAEREADAHTRATRR